MGKPSAKALGKRKASTAAPKKVSSLTWCAALLILPQGKQPTQELQPNGKPKRRPDQPKKVPLRDQKFIPVPQSSFAGPSGSGSSDDGGMDLDSEEEEGLDIGDAAAFARNVDSQALGR